MIFGKKIVIIDDQFELACVVNRLKLFISHLLAEIATEHSALNTPKVDHENCIHALSE